MRFIKHWIATLGLGLGLSLGLGLVASGAGASPAEPVNGKDYRTLDKPQPTESGKKVEVTEFFWYSCPHCNAFDPALIDWVKKQGDHINFKRVPVAFRESFVPQQKLFYTLEAMGKVDELHGKIFHAIHVEHVPLETDQTITDYVVKQGVDRKKFLDLYNSFGVTTKAHRATQLQELYKIDGVPTIAIGGKYLTSPSIVAASVGNVPEPALFAASLQVMTVLVNRVGKDQK
jgi:thiol:disulfide interchange protein DsbA